jgi:uncharacterized membrane protein (DUF485 family)
MNPLYVHRCRLYCATVCAVLIAVFSFVLFVSFMPDFKYNERLRETTCTYLSYKVNMRNDCPVPCGRFTCYIPYCYHYAIVTSVQLYGGDNPWPLFAGYSQDANVADASLQYTFPINGTATCYTDGETVLRAPRSTAYARNTLIATASIFAAIVVGWSVLEVYVWRTRNNHDNAVQITDVTPAVENHDLQ